MAGLPKDPMILFSVLNMKLRDFYPSLDALCDDLDEDKQAILDAMAAAGVQIRPGKESVYMMKAPCRLRQGALI